MTSVFSANPAYIKGLANAGIDWVSIANNHIGDQGRRGVLQTMANLDDDGIKHGGAGHDAAEAHTATLIDVRLRKAVGGYKIQGGGYVAGQPAVATPKSVWNPDLPDPVAHRDAWIEVPATEPPENGFKLQWEAFLRHVVLDEPFPWDFVEGARGGQLYELAEQSWRERRWIDVPELSL